VLLFSDPEYVLPLDVELVDEPRFEVENDGEELLLGVE